MDRLFDCLAETALEYASKSKGRHSYKELKKELGLRFDLREPPTAARQNLYLMKQSEDESLEAYLQRVLTAAMHGLKTSDNSTMQLLATEAFLRGCKHKEAAALVSNEAPQTIQEACQKIKTVLANRKAIFGSKVSFQENAFSIQEETRVSDIEKKLDTLTDMVTRSSRSLYRDNTDRPRYSVITEVDLQPEPTEIDRNRVNITYLAVIGHLALKEGNNINMDLLIRHMEGNMLLLN